MFGGTPFEAGAIPKKAFLPKMKFIAWDIVEGMLGGISFSRTKPPAPLRPMNSGFGYPGKNCSLTAERTPRHQYPLDLRTYHHKRSSNPPQQKSHRQIQQPSYHPVPQS